MSDVSIDPAVAERQHHRGRRADTPMDIPARGWRDVLTRVKVEAKRDHVTLLAAGIAFYTLLAAVPALIAIISIYGLVADPADVANQVVKSLAAAPNEVRNLVTTQLESITANAGGGTIFAIIVGLLFALWAASAGIGHLMEALNIAYGEEETRGYARRKLIAVAFTLGAVLFLVVAFGAIAVLPALLAKTGLGAAGRVIISVARWVLLFAGMIVGLALLYRFGPDRESPRWRWATPGALFAAVFWIAGSILFSIYTANFGRYNETYGSLGAVVVTMLWLFLTAVVIILGAEANAELERQTLSDSTTGAPRPIGRREAYAADTVGGTADDVKAEQRLRSSR